MVCSSQILFDGSSLFESRFLVSSWSTSETESGQDGVAEPQEVLEPVGSGSGDVCWSLTHDLWVTSGSAKVLPPSCYEASD